METGGNLLRTLELFLTDPAFSGRKKAGKVEFEHDIFPWEYTKDSVSLCSKVMASGLMDSYFVLAPSLLNGIRRYWVKRKRQSMNP